MDVRLELSKRNSVNQSMGATQECYEKYSILAGSNTGLIKVYMENYPEFRK